MAKRKLEARRRCRLKRRDVLVCLAVMMLLGFVFMFVMSETKIQIQDYAQDRCNDLHGQLVFYECNYAGDWFVKEEEKCDMRKIGFFCKLSDGSEVDVNIKEAING